MGEKLVQTDTAGIKSSPPLQYLGFAFLGIGVDFLFPAPIELPSYAIYVGIAIALLSLGFIGYIARLFRKAGTSSNPGKTTNNIVDYGPYKFSRNPIYLATCGIPIGFGLIFNNYYTLLAFIPALALVYFVAIAKEERYLENKFGAEYLNYKSKVRRWL